MFQIFYKDDDNLRQLRNIQPGAWVNITSPSGAELEAISKLLDIPLSMLTDPLDEDERSRVEIEDDYLLILLRVPYFAGEEEVPFKTVPLGIIYGKNFIVTVGSRNPAIIQDFIQGRVKNFVTTNRERFIFQIFYRAALLFLNYLKEINMRSQQIEKELQDSVCNTELIRLQLLGKSLVYFTTSLKANEIMIGRLANIKQFKVSEEDEDLFADVAIEYRQALEMANVYNNILTGMSNTFASIISNNLNLIMRILTSITIVLMLPTLLTSLYGMNVQLPFANNPHAFFIVMGIGVFLALAAIIIMIKRRWI